MTICINGDRRRSEEEHGGADVRLNFCRCGQFSGSRVAEWTAASLGKDTWWENVRMRSRILMGDAAEQKLYELSSLDGRRVQPHVLHLHGSRKIKA